MQENLGLKAKEFEKFTSTKEDNKTVKHKFTNFDEFYEILTR